MRIWIIWLLLLIPIASALEECKGTIVTTESPCLVLLPYTGDCTALEVYFYNETTHLHTTTMFNYSDFLCNGTFNYSILGTYVFNYSTGDTGSIIVENDSDMMLAITVGLGIFSAMLLFLAFKLEESHFLLKLLFTIIAITSLTILPVTYITGDTSLVFHKLASRFIVIFWIYVSVYFVYWLFNRFAKTVPQ